MAAAADYPGVNRDCADVNPVIEIRATIPFLRTLRPAVGVVEDFVIVLEWGVPLECDSKISMTVFVPLDLITLTDADFRLVHAGRSHIYILVATIGMGVPGHTAVTAAPGPFCW